MFMSDVHKKDEIKTIAMQDLKKFGIKFRPKKAKTNNGQVAKTGSKVFKRLLTSLSTQTVTLKTGQQIIVPKLIHELCSFILSGIETEGLFRKEGSKARQNEIKLTLDAGCLLGDEHHVIDVAVVLKTFLRELPEPLIPYNYHELFLRCILLEKNKLEAMLLACLLLPIEHLNTLSYLMQFFYEIAEYSEANKMNPYNLAVVIGPSVFPIEEKLTPNPQLRMLKTCDIFKLLIENARSIGVLSEDILERIGNSKVQSNEDTCDKKKKKRRSGSLTRMFNGLKKIVGGKSTDDDYGQFPVDIVTPDLLLTPINRSVKKRKSIDGNGLSNKKKKNVLHKLPEQTLLNNQYIPIASLSQTPVSLNPKTKYDNKDLLVVKTSMMKTSSDNSKDKKLHSWYNNTKSTNNKTSAVKHLMIKDTDSNSSSSKINKIIPKSLLERRWSIVTQKKNLKRNKKRNSCAASIITTANDNKNNKINNNIEEKKKNNNVGVINNNITMDKDYVRISKIEYEEIKNRVTAIERRISIELDQHVNDDDNATNLLCNVQNAYEQTLVETEPLSSPTTDHLAKRLSRELKIRRSSEQKIIRSPSARKIGSMRRRSRELERSNQNNNGKKLRRHQSCHIINNNNSATINNKSDQTLLDKSNQWISAEGFFETLKSCNNSSNNDDLTNRTSLVKLRNRNAGMVLAKTKLFDRLLHDSDLDSTISNNNSADCKVLMVNKNQQKSTKIGGCSNRNVDIDSRRLSSYRVRQQLKTNDLRGRGAVTVTTATGDNNKKKISMSPARRKQLLNGNIHRQKIQNAAKKQLLLIDIDDDTTTTNTTNYNKENIEKSLNGGCVKNQLLITPLKDFNRRLSVVDPINNNSGAIVTPYIKKSLITVKSSPKRLCRTPAYDRKTPLKATSKHYYNNK